jgi:transcriptional regulator with XRE-family HTH domain
LAKSLKDIVKEIQFRKNWTVEQVAGSIGYSRVHLTKEMSKGNNPSLIKLLFEKHNAALQNVSRETVKVEGDAGKIIGEHEERLLRIEAGMEVYESAIAGLLSEKKTDFTKKVGELREAVRVAVNRRFDELDRRSKP